MKISKDDIESITNINFTCNNLHDLSNDIYESLMDGDYPEVRMYSQSLIQSVAELIQSLDDEL
jgi:hypothetical protein